MTTTPISNAAMYYSEPHGFKAVPYSVARDLELELIGLREAAQAVVEQQVERERAMSDEQTTLLRAPSRTPG